MSWKINGLKYKCMNQYENSLFLLSEDDNLLFEYSLQKNELIYICRIKRGCSFYTTSCIVDDKIFYFSYFGNEYCVYDIKEKQILYKTIEVEFSGKKFGSCSTCLIYGDYIYIICGDDNIPLIKLDTKNYIAESKSDWISIGKSKYSQDLKCNIYTNPCVVNNVLWITLNIPDVILKYNMELDSYELIELEKQDIMYSTVNYDGSSLWLTGDKKKVIRWNPDTQELIVIDSFPDGFEIRENARAFGWSNMFYTGVCFGEYIIYPALASNMFIGLDTKTNTMTNVMSIKDKEYCFFCFEINDDKGKGMWLQLNQFDSLSWKLLRMDEGGNSLIETEFPEVLHETKNVNKGETDRYCFRELFQGMLDWFVDYVG